MLKKISFSADARTKLKRGIDVVADAVSATIGPSGRNAIIGRPYQTPLITNDGVTIAREITLEDEIEQLGVEIVQQAAKLSNDKAGDGTTTTTVILKHLIDTVYEKLNQPTTLIQTEVDVMVIKREIEDACLKVLTELDKIKKPIKTKEDLIKAATISVESKDLGEKIAEMIWELGEDALVTVEMYQGSDIDFSITEGAEIKSGMVSPYFANNGEQAVYENPNILITNEKIEHTKQIQSIINQLNQNGSSNLIIICDAFEKNVLLPLVQTHMTTPFKFLLIKSPQFGQLEYLEDIALLTGTQVINKEKGMRLEDTLITQLGSCKKIVADKDKTLLIGIKKAPKELIKELKAKKPESLFDKEKLQKRVAFLSSAMGMIRVGAESETEKEYLKLKIDDAVYATKAALEDGYVQGGGIALKTVAENIGDTILTKALNAPYTQIQKNAGGNLVIGEDIIDPVKVTKNAVQNACSVAKIFLTTEIAIADKREKKKDQSLDEE